MSHIDAQICLCSTALGPRPGFNNCRWVNMLRRYYWQYRQQAETQSASDEFLFVATVDQPCARRPSRRKADDRIGASGWRRAVAARHANALATRQCRMACSGNHQLRASSAANLIAFFAAGGKYQSPYVFHRTQARMKSISAAVRQAGRDRQSDRVSRGGFQ